MSSSPAREKDRRLTLPQASNITRQWEVDLLPLPMVIENDPAARSVAVLIAAPPVVVGVELVNRPSAEPEAMWESPMGEAEHVLYAEVSSRWIAWRDALLRAGVVDRAELAGRTIELEIKWPNTPHVGFRGRTPRQVVLAERKAREKGGKSRRR